jgi:hypothetical protein
VKTDLRKVIRGKTSLLALAALLAAAPLAGQSMRTRQLNLAEMVSLSGLIVRGQVTSVRTGKHTELKNLDTVVVTLRVSEVLKGTAGEEVTFQQSVLDARDVPGQLGYKTGEDVLLMLLPPSRYGLTSPAGYEQGRFRVMKDAQGNLQVANSANNLGLLYKMETSTPQLDAVLAPATRQMLTSHKSGPIAYDRFKELVQGVIAARR